MREHLHPELQTEKYVVFVDVSHHYTDCTDEVCRLLGYDRTEIPNMRIDDLSYNMAYMPPPFVRPVVERLLSVLPDKANSL